MDNIWNELYEAAKAVLKPGAVSQCVEAGGVAAAIECGSGIIYTGVCVDTACTLGICAERNAIFHMLAEGEDTVRRVIAISSKGEAMAPCGACRELMVQLNPEGYREIEIMLDYQSGRIVKLGELTPDWWV